MESRKKKYPKSEDKAAKPTDDEEQREKEKFVVVMKSKSEADQNSDRNFADLKDEEIN